METKLAGKVIIVTGASGGIGGAIVENLISEKSNLVVHYHRAAERAAELVSQAKSAGLKAIAIQADLTSEADVDRLFDQTITHLGTPDILIANAGVWPSDNTSLMEMDIDRWNRTLQQNLGSVFLSCRRFMKTAVAAQTTAPAIVMTGSTAGHFGEAGHSDYATAKAGMMYGLLQSLKTEFCKLAPGARVNAVCPGWTVTPMTDKFTGNEEGVLKALKTIPLDKFAMASDIANAVTFLASNRLAGHITGQTLFVSGGMEGRVVNETPTRPWS